MSPLKVLRPLLYYSSWSLPWTPRFIRLCEVGDLGHLSHRSCLRRDRVHLPKSKDPSTYRRHWGPFKEDPSLQGFGLRDS